jgi:hypothetical protein
VDIAKVILKTKLWEWEDMRENKPGQIKLDNLAKREKEKEEESRKTIFLLIQQQKIHFDTQSAREIQDQDTKRAQ